MKVPFTTADFLDRAAAVYPLRTGVVDEPGQYQDGGLGSLTYEQLAARARGLGSAWTTLHLRYEKEINELLGIPPEVRQGVLLPTAYFTGETFKPAPREPVAKVLHVDRW